MSTSMFTLDYLRRWVYFRPVKATLETAKLVFFYGRTQEEQRSFPLSKAVELLEQDEFDNTRPTMLYLHGFTEHLKSESVKCILNAYLKRGDHNIIVVDWAEMAEGNYIFQVIPNSSKLGIQLASTILDLTNNGFDLSKLHIVGHSIGAHLGGLIARKIHNDSNGVFKIKRISGLDPAFAPFYPAFFYKALNKDDAEMVDVVHTDAWLYGGPIATGTVDFWPNKGKTLQLGITKKNYKILTEIDLINHQRSWRIWSESVESREGKIYPAVKCKNWKEFRLGKFDPIKDIGYMGIDCPMGLSGNYYLQTNTESPYSRGSRGIIFEKMDEEKSKKNKK